MSARAMSPKKCRVRCSLGVASREADLGQCQASRQAANAARIGAGGMTAMNRRSLDACMVVKAGQAGPRMAPTEPVPIFESTFDKVYIPPPRRRLLRVGVASLKNHPALPGIFI